MAEELKVNIVGDASQLKGALNSAGGNVTSFSQKIGKVGKIATVAGVAVTAAFVKIVTGTAKVGDMFDKMSLRTGIAVEDLSALAYAADISGTSIETMEKGIKGLTKTMDDASKGVGEGLESFEELDIAVVDTEGNLRSTVDVIKEIASKISTIENPTKQAALAMDFFGAKAGPQLLPLLKAGEGGIDDLMKKAKELGITMSTEAATKAAEFTDRVTDLKGSLAGAGRTIGEVLIPALIPMIEKVTEIVGKVAAWAKENPKLVATITKVAAVVGVIAAVGGPILMAVAAFSGVGVAIAAIASPIGIVIAAVAGLAIAWKTNFLGIRDITKSVFEFVKKVFASIVKFISDSFERLKKVIASVKKFVAGIAGESITGAINVQASIVAATPAIEPGFHQTGIDYVPKKGFYGLDPGEKVLTAEQAKTYDQRQTTYSPTVQVTVQGNGNAAEIKKAVEQALDESSRQYNRRGFETVPGIG